MMMLQGRVVGVPRRTAWSHSTHVCSNRHYRQHCPRGLHFPSKLHTWNKITRLYASSQEEEDEEEKLRAGNQAYAALSQSIEKEAAEAVEHLQGTSLFLVGMMGTGKSTVGKMLGQALGYCFLDSDSLIEQLAGKSVADIFAEDGEEDFRVLETEVLQEIAPFARCVVATGGGAACKSQNWGHMQTGISIWLDGRPAMLAQRVLRDSSNDRPLVAIDGAETMSEEEIFDATVGRLEALLEARRSQYAYADLTVSLEGTGDDDAAADPATVVLRILTSLNARIRKDAKEREERKNFEIVNNDLPPSMRVVSNINQTAQDDPYMP
jgi:shikimate kinase